MSKKCSHNHTTKEFPSKRLKYSPSVMKTPLASSPATDSSTSAPNTPPSSLKNHENSEISNTSLQPLDQLLQRMDRIEEQHRYKDICERINDIGNIKQKDKKIIVQNHVRVNIARLKPLFLFTLCYP